MLDEAIKSCDACSLRKGCRAPVPGNGLEKAEVMLIGEAPGEWEDEQGIPFVGQAGQFLDALLRFAGTYREAVFVSNTVKCHPPRNADPTREQVGACSKWLKLEMLAVKPRIVVCLGRIAAQQVFKVTEPMEHIHGQPIYCDGYVGLPAYHPAAGIHQTSLIRQIYDDFEVLKRLMAGADPSSLMTVDEYERNYVAIDRADEAVELLEELSKGEYALDIETVNGKPWSWQVSGKPGMAYFVPWELMPLKRVGGKVVVHYYLHDAQFVDMPDFTDTMVMAYLLGLPQGLKTLARDLCGMKMMEYEEVVGPYKEEKAGDYLERAITGEEWSAPEPVEEAKWDNKVGKVVVRWRKPKPISGKIKRILASETEMYRKWHDINAGERAEVESVMGVMPEASLRDAEQGEVVAYSCADPDATLRAMLKMRPMIEERGLGYTLGAMDLPTLPVALEMRRRGMAVDRVRLEELSEYYTVEMAKAAEEAAEIVGERFNPNSSIQVARILYEKLRFPITRLTTTGKASTDDRELKKVKHPVVEKVLRYRELGKNRDAYADALREAVHGDGRVRADIKTTRTETGRWAVSDPQLQAIPIRTEEGRKIRGAFVATEEEREE